MGGGGLDPEQEGASNQGQTPMCPKMGENQSPLREGAVRATE